MEEKEILGWEDFLISLSLQKDDRFQRTEIEERRDSGAMFENVVRCHRQNWIAPPSSQRKYEKASRRMS